jgi:hypothetical protein
MGAHSAFFATWVAAVRKLGALFIFKYLIVEKKESRFAK